MASPNGAAGGARGAKGGASAGGAAGTAPGGSPPNTIQVIASSWNMKLPTFSWGTEKDEVSPRDFIEWIKMYCKI